MIRPMSRPSWLQRRPLLLAASASAGVIGGHVLDALGLLPGVHESAEVRAAALAPTYDVLTVVGAAILAVGVEALLRRRRPWLAVAALIGGQTALLGLPEAVAEATASGGGGAGGEGEKLAALAVAVGLQVILAAAAVGLAVLVDTLLLRLPRPRALLPVPVGSPARAGHGTAPAGRIAGGVRGRGPPVPVVL
jgi:hypothetical protein